MTRNLYVELLDRLEGAREAGFHHEACWFASAIFDDITSDVIWKAGDEYACDDELSDKLTTILQWMDAKPTKAKTDKDKKTNKKQKKSKWLQLRTFERRLFSDIQAWLESRELLIARLMFERKSLSEIDALIAELSAQGLHLSEELCAANDGKIIVYPFASAGSEI